MIAESSLPKGAVEGKQSAKGAKVTALVPGVEKQGRNSGVGVAGVQNPASNEIRADRKPFE